MLLILRACASDWPLGASPEWEGPLCRLAPGCTGATRPPVKHNRFEAATFRMLLPPRRRVRQIGRKEPLPSGRAPSTGLRRNATGARAHL